MPQIVEQASGDHPHWQAAIAHFNRDVLITRSTFHVPWLSSIRYSRRSEAASVYGGAVALTSMCPLS
jgi:hypothetical protein